MLDEVPDIPGFAEVWGTSAHTCPYCEGFEHRDERLAILAADARGEPRLGDDLRNPARPDVRV
jgi:thioredoxin reductase